MSAVRGACALRTLGLKRNERGQAPPAVMWRCEHGRLHHPDHPNPCCESPMARAILRDSAELLACRQMRGLDDDKAARCVRQRRLDYAAIRAAVGTPSALAARFGCTHQMINLIQRGRR